MLMCCLLFSHAVVRVHVSMPENFPRAHISGWAASGPAVR